MIAALSNAAIPRPLKIVAYLFIVVGILSVIDTAVELFIGRININLGIFYIVIGQGLLRFNPHSLAWAVFFTWIGLIVLPIAAVASFFTSSNFQVFGLNAGQVPHGLCFTLSAAMFVVCCWQLGILKDRQVRQLFFYSASR